MAKRHKPAFWFRVMVANQTAVWLGGRQSQLVGVVTGRPLSFDVFTHSSSFWRRCEPAFLGGHRALGGSGIASYAELSMFGVAST